jgi:DNA primase
MSQIRQVKEATDIVEVIGERISLQRSGTSLRGLCPFHSEKSPSFFVNEQFQRYKCFGCGESGDVFSFLEKYEGMTFNEALSYLAERAGITLTSYQPSAEDDQRQRLLSLLHLTKEYFHFLLLKHESGATAREYLKKRGVTKESIVLFQLGYALPAWDGLIAYLHGKKKYSMEDLKLAGLVVTGRQGREYDRFRDRIMFPLTNHRGQVVGFSGRSLDPQAKEAKYINSPETQLYHKSEMLYGYSELYQEIRKKKEVVVVEGEFDAISSAQAHVNNVVAIKGSALTSQHLQLLQRAAERVLFSLDMDSAGVAATKRAIQMAREVNIDMRVVVLASGKDPDELARTAPKEWRETVKSSISAYEYLIRAAITQHDIKTAEGKRAVIDELAPIIGNIAHAVEQDVYIKRLASALEVREELVRMDIQKFKGQVGRQAPPRAVEKEDPAAPPELTRQQKLEAYGLFLLLHASEESILGKITEVASHEWRTVGVKPLLENLKDELPSKTLNQAVAQLSSDQQQLVFELSTQPAYLELLEQLNLEDEWQKVVADMRQEQIRARLAVINTELEKLEQSGVVSEEQEQKQNLLLQEIVQLQKKLSTQTSP